MAIATRRFRSAAALAGGLLTTCIATAAIRVALELVVPISSGVGPLYPFVQLPIYLVLSASVAAVVLVGGWLRGRPRIVPSHCFLLGAASGLVATLQLTTPWMPEFPVALIVFGCALGLATFVYARVGGRVGA